MSPTEPVVAVTNPFAQYAKSDTVTIRGRQLVLAELANPKLYDPSYVADLKMRVSNAQPYAHLAEDGWFNPALLELIYEEFDNLSDSTWKQWTTRHQNTYRSPVKPQLGPASSLYFSLVNSSWFVDFISAVMSVDELIVDQQLYGGGLHESRTGGKFGIHRDFDRHLTTGLNNEMSMMTYLNKNWNPDWGGALEIWDRNQKRSVCQFEPDFGRTVIVKHGPHSFHGHPKPLTMPEGHVRRSLSSYYYTSPHAGADKPQQVSTYFVKIKTSDMVHATLRGMTPPLIWDGVRRILFR